MSVACTVACVSAAIVQAIMPEPVPTSRTRNGPVSDKGNRFRNEMFGFGARDEDAFVNQELAPVETGASEQIGDRHAARALATQTLERFGFLSRRRRLAVSHEPFAPAIEYVAQEQLRIGVR